MSLAPPIVKHLGIMPYEPVWEAMRAFTAQRDIDTPDELWLLQHPPIYTLGQAGKPEHLLRHNETPLVKIDRGGQITYHGPGQLILYLLIDLTRRQLKVRALVTLIEQAIINTLADYGLTARRKKSAPGVYINNAKIAALGLRIRRGCSYHGLSLNVDMNLSPFDNINPCGYPGLKIVQIKDFGISETVDTIGDKLLTHLLRLLTDA